MKCNKSIPIQVLILLVLLLLSVVEAQKPSDDPSSDGAVAWDEGTKVSPSMSVVIIVLVMGFFITGCISIYIQHCVDSSSSSSSVVTATGGIANRNNTICGLDQSVIDTFPVFPYSAVKELKIGKGALECAVCLSEFEEDETLRFLPKCDHVFHAQCIDMWLKGHSTCPVCRDNLVVVAPYIPPDHLQSSATPMSPISNSEIRITISENNETISLPKKLPRAHSTGHSLIQAGENCERYTLRLPAEVRRELLARTKLKRAKSLVTLPRQTSSRRGYRGGGGGGGEGSGSSRYGRFFGRSFLMRVASFRSTVKIGVTGDLTEGSKVPKTCSKDESFPPSLPV